VRLRPDQALCPAAAADRNILQGKGVRPEVQPNCSVAKVNRITALPATTDRDR
jgi:hypothetical protein